MKNLKIKNLNNTKSLMNGNSTNDTNNSANNSYKYGIAKHLFSKAILLLILVFMNATHSFAQVTGTLQNPVQINADNSFLPVQLSITSNTFWISFTATSAAANFMVLHDLQNGLGVDEVTVFKSSPNGEQLFQSQSNPTLKDITYCYTQFLIGETYYAKLTKTNANNINARISIQNYVVQMPFGCNPGTDNCKIYNQNFSNITIAQNGWQNTFGIGTAATTNHNLAGGSVAGGLGFLSVNLQSNPVTNTNFVMATSDPIPVCVNKTYTVCFKYWNGYPNGTMPYFKVLVNGTINATASYFAPNNNNVTTASFTFTATTPTVTISIKSDNLGHYNSSSYGSYAGGASTDIYGADLSFDELFLYGANPIADDSTDASIYCSSFMPIMDCDVNCQLPNRTYNYNWLDNAVSQNSVGTGTPCTVSYNSNSAGGYQCEVTSVSSLIYYDNLVCKSNLVTLPSTPLPVCPCDLGMTSASYNYATNFTINQNTTWTPAGIVVAGVTTPYPTANPAAPAATVLVNCNITIAPNVTFTIDPGVTVLLGNSGKFTVERGATQTTLGAVFTAKAATLTGVTSPLTNTLGCMWQGIDVKGYNNVSYTATTMPNGKINLTGCNIEHAKCAIYCGERPTGATWETALANKVGGYTYIITSIFKNNYISVYYPQGLVGAEANCFITGTEFKCTAPVRQPAYCNNNNTNNPSGRSVSFIKGISWYFLGGLIDNCGFRNTNDPVTPMATSLSTSNKTVAMDITNCYITPKKCTFSVVEKGIWMKYLSTMPVRGLLKATCNKFEYVRQGILVTGSTADNYIVRNQFKKGLPSIGSTTQVGAAVILDGVKNTEVIDNTIEDYPNGVMCFNTSTSNTNSPIIISRNVVSYTNLAPFNYSNKTGIILGGINSTTKMRCNTLNNGYNYGIKYVTQANWNNTAISNLLVANQGIAGSEIAGNLFGNTTSGGVVKDLGRVGVGSPGTYFYNNWTGMQPIFLQNLISANVQPTTIGGNYNTYCFSNLPSGAPTSLVPAPPVNCFSSSYVFTSSPTAMVYLPSGDASNMRSIPEIETEIDNTTDEFVLEKLYAELLMVYDATNQNNDAELFLQSLNTPEADKNLIDLYLKETQYADAATILATMPDGVIDELAYKELYSIFVDLGLQNRKLDEVTANEKLLIEAVQALDVKASATAVNILANYFGWEYAISCEKMGECDGSNTRNAGGSPTDKFNAALGKVKTDREGNANKGIATVNSNTNTLLMLAPNPAANATTIYYRTKNTTDVVTIIVVDINGKQIINQSLSNTNGKYELLTNNLANGIYNVMLQSNTGNYASQKLIVKH